MAPPQRVAYLNLTTGVSDINEVPEEITRSLLGGRGINMYFLLKHTSPDTDPLSPENPLIIGPGLVSGLSGIGASRANISGKSPETGLLGDANIGGYFATAMKRAGLDYLVITGSAKTPVYLHFDAENLRLLPAEELWGKPTGHTNTTLKERHGPNSEVISIGPAGENLVRFAAIMHRRKNAAARTGLGCLMGTKQLKAIVADGDHPVKPVDETGFKALRAELLEKLKTEPLVKMLGDFGSPFLYMLINRRIKMGRIHNGLSTKFSENVDISPQVLKAKYYRAKAGCYACPVGCHHEYDADGLSGEGPEYTTFASFGPMLGIGELKSVLKINDLINQYGLDASSTANLIAWATELFTRGVICESQTQGLKLNWGDAAVVTELIHQIAHRQGFGAVLADGGRAAVEKLGEQTADYLLWIKYLPQSDPVDLRYFPAYALGNAVASRGSDHLRSRPTWEAHGIPQARLEEIYGGPVSPDPRSYEGKGRVIWWWENYLAVVDALGLCKLIAHNCQPGTLDFGFFSKLIKYATGLDLSPVEIFDAGERIVNLERLFLAREGVTRKHDLPPQRYFEPLSHQEGLRPEEKDLALDRASFESLLDEYYQLRGWDKEGIPLPETIEKMGLGEWKSPSLAPAP